MAPLTDEQVDERIDELDDLSRAVAEAKTLAGAAKFALGLAARALVFAILLDEGGRPGG